MDLSRAGTWAICRAGKGVGGNRWDSFSGGYVVENEYERTEMNGETAVGR